MATNVRASCVFPLPIDLVWTTFRDFSKTPLLIESVKSVNCSSSPFELGCVRTIRWQSGDVRSQRLIELSDVEFLISWELVSAEPPIDTSAMISSVKLYRITEDDTTMVEWSSDFAGTSRDFVNFEQSAYHKNLCDIRSHLTGKKLPLLYHVFEGPSTRVVWLASILSLPLQIKFVSPSSGESEQTELSCEEGGVVTCFKEQIDNEVLTLYESGTIVLYLIEKYDRTGLLDPFPKGSPQRAKFLQWFFYTSSTTDHLLFDAYKQMHVVPLNKSSDSLITSLRDQWDRQIAKVFEDSLQKSDFVCGNKFTAADVMVAWSLNFASYLGWVDNERYPALTRYLTAITSLPHYQKAARVSPSTSLNTPPFYIV